MNNLWIKLKKILETEITDFPFKREVKDWPYDKRGLTKVDSFKLYTTLPTSSGVAKNATEGIIFLIILVIVIILIYLSSKFGFI